MKIGIDARLYTQTGVGRYLRNIIEQLQRLDKKNEYFIYLRKEEFDLFDPQNTRWKKRLVEIPLHTVKEQFLLPKILLADNLDLAHFPYFNVPIFYPKKYLLTIHDLIVDHFDTGRASTLPMPIFKIKRWGYKLSMTSAVKRATIITAISQTTKKEIISHYRVKEDRIVVTYDALDENFRKTYGRCRPKNYYGFPYILYVGNAYPHKNLERLLEALKIIHRSNKIKLVLAGNDEYFYPRLKNYADKLGVGKEVYFFGEANDEQLINLYTFSEFLVFPSLMEGFGLPSLEALYCNRLPVVADIPVFREIWGDNLVFFNPNNAFIIAEQIMKVLAYGKKRYEMLVKKAKKRLDYFSWEKTAKQTLRLYENCFCL